MTSALWRGWSSQRALWQAETLLCGPRVTVSVETRNALWLMCLCWADVRADVRGYHKNTVKYEITLDVVQMSALKCIYIYEEVVTPAGRTCRPVPDG